MEPQIPLEILIVDDSPAMRKFMQRILHLSGIPVRCCRGAGDGAQALQMLREAPADIVLTDINMPGMNGEEFVRRVSGDPDLQKIPILVVSTDHTSQRMDRLFALGARGYVAKPFLPETLREEIERILAGEDRPPLMQRVSVVGPN